MNILEILKHWTIEIDYKDTEKACYYFKHDHEEHYKHVCFNHFGEVFEDIDLIILNRIDINRELIKEIITNEQLLKDFQLHKKQLINNENEDIYDII